MAYLTNQQLIDSITVLITGVADVMITKADLKRALADYPTIEDLNGGILRLERKLDSHIATSIQHNLETRKMIGDLNNNAQLREGLAKAAGAT